VRAALPNGSIRFSSDFGIDRDTGLWHREHMPSTQVSKYRLIVRSGAPANTDYHENIISLYDVNNKHIANLRFTNTDPPGKSGDGGYTTIIYPRDQYLCAVDMLRNENPVYFVEDNALEGGIRTGTSENVGENDA
jgi:hypothetical protein